MDLDLAKLMFEEDEASGEEGACGGAAGPSGVEASKEGVDSQRESEKSSAAAAGSSLTGKKEKAYVEAPKTKAELAKEFREDCVLDPMPIIKRFFCCVCGEPAGKDCYACSKEGHVTCKACKVELGLKFCFQPLDEDKTKKTNDGIDMDTSTCRASIHSFKSKFRDFVYDNTKLFCPYKDKGCGFISVWNEMKKHREDCAFKDPSRKRI